MQKLKVRSKVKRQVLAPDERPEPPPRRGGTAIQYQQFRVDLAGYTEIDLATFKSRVQPLRRRDWSAADAAYAKELVAAGGGYALRRLCGVGHPQLSYDRCEVARPPLTAAEVETKLRQVAQGIDLDNWAAVYLRHLETNAPDLEDKDFFAEYYRTGSQAFRAKVRETLAAIAAETPANPDQDETKT